jgi:hypothetical protein
MRAQGLRPVQIWAPDVRSPDFAAEVHRQSERVAAADRVSDDMDFVEAISDSDECDARTSSPSPAVSTRTSHGRP